MGLVVALVLLAVTLAAAIVRAGPVLALLLGANIGPNLTYVGSLASMLWLKVARKEGENPAGLWASLQLIGP